MENYIPIIQAVSGITFSSFLTMHIMSHTAANLGIGAANNSLIFFRVFYQNEYVEPVILGAMAVHLIAGVAQYMRRKSNHFSLFRFTGYVLALFSIPHVIFTRIAPVFVFGDSSLIDYSFINYHMTKHPFLLYPYLALFGISGIYHSILGFKSAFRSLKMNTGFSVRTLNRMALVLSLVFLSAILAMGGWYETIPIPLRKEFLKLDAFFGF